MPLIDRTFSDIITFTRASTATYFDSAGVLQSAANDAPRFDYDPVTLAARGMLIEEQRTNLLLWSEEFDNAAWGKTGLNTTGTPPWVDVAVAPDGNTTADKLTEDTSPGEHAVNQVFSFTVGTTYTMSLFAKAAERTLIRVGAGNPATWDAGVIVDLTTGTITSTIGGSGYVQDVGNGWYRISVTGAALVTGITGRSIRLVSTGTTVNYTGDGTSGLYVWGAQFEASAFPTSYIPTTTAAATRAADVASVNTLSPWYNSTEYTLYYEGSVVSNSDSIVYAGIADTFNDVSYFFRSAPNQITGIRNGGVSSASMAINFSPSSSAVFKQAMGVKADDFAFCINGGSVAVDPLGPVPASAVRLGIGNAPWSASGGSQRQQWIRRIGYYKRRLSNAQLQAITQ